MKSKLNAVIIDDENIAIETLELLLQNYCPHLEIIATAQNALQGIKAINTHQPDIVFLDVDMPGGSGFDMLESIKEINFKIIFTTASNEHAIKAIKAKAEDYLLKPIDVDELVSAVDKITSQNKKKESHTLSLPSLEGLQFVDIETIVYLEADNNYTTFYLKNGKKLTISKTLKDFEDELETKDFFRIHQSHCINLHFVDRYVKGRGGFVIMKDGTELEVSVRRKDLFLERIGNL